MSSSCIRIPFYTIYKLFHNSFGQKSNCGNFPSLKVKLIPNLDIT